MIKLSNNTKRRLNQLAKNRENFIILIAAGILCASLFMYLNESGKTGISNDPLATLANHAPDDVSDECDEKLIELIHAFAIDKIYDLELNPSNSQEANSWSCQMAKKFHSLNDWQDWEKGYLFIEGKFYYVVIDKNEATSWAWKIYPYSLDKLLTFYHFAGTDVFSSYSTCKERVIWAFARINKPATYPDYIKTWRSLLSKNICSVSHYGSCSYLSSELTELAIEFAEFPEKSQSYFQSQIELAKEPCDMNKTNEEAFEFAIEQTRAKFSPAN
jgi:hypothetical protein